MDPPLQAFLILESDDIDSPKSEVIKTKKIDGRLCSSYLPISYDGDMHRYFRDMAGHELGGANHLWWISNLCMQMGKFYAPGLVSKFDSRNGVRSVPNKSMVKFFEIKQPSLMITPHHIGYNYYHFMIDSLPRFSFRENFAKFSKPVLFLPLKDSFQSNAMKLLIGKNYPIYDTAHRVLMRECAITWPLRRTTAVDFLRKKSARVIPNKNFKRIYISRRNALFRQVRNENELEPILKKFGFAIIECESINFYDQVSLFKSAEIVCGPHGAGLTNIAFCNKNTSVLEIIMDERLAVNVGASFWELACAGGLDYHIVSGSRIPIDEANEVDGALYVDPQKFEAALDYLVKRRK